MFVCFVKLNSNIILHKFISFSVLIYVTLDTVHSKIHKFVRIALLELVHFHQTSLVNTLFIEDITNSESNWCFVK